MNIEKPTNKTEAELYLLGIIQGLNTTRLSVWGIGYDSDETALMLRRSLTDEIFKLKEILEIKNIGDSWFDGVQSLLQEHKK